MNIGDIVEIVDVGQIYSSYKTWIQAYGLKNWNPNQDLPKEDDTLYKVIFRAPHMLHGDPMLYYIEDVNTEMHYIIGEEGLKRVSAGITTIDEQEYTIESMKKAAIEREKTIEELTDKFDKLTKDYNELKKKYKKFDSGYEPNLIQNGVFGVERCSGDAYDFEYFVLVKMEGNRFRMVYESGEHDTIGYEKWDDFDIRTGQTTDAEDGSMIIYLDAEAKSFNHLKSRFNNIENGYSNNVWRR